MLAYTRDNHTCTLPFHLRHHYICHDCRVCVIKALADDDSRYDFANGAVHRQVAVNWQLAQGTASATDEEVREKVVRSFRRTERGYVHEVALAQRYLAPIDLKRGTQFGFGLFLHDREKVGDTTEHGLSLSCEPGRVCNGRPQSWPMAILD